MRYNNMFLPAQSRQAMSQALMQPHIPQITSPSPNLMGGALQSYNKTAQNGASMYGQNPSQNQPLFGSDPNYKPNPSVDAQGNWINPDTQTPGQPMNITPDLGQGAPVIPVQSQNLPPAQMTGDFNPQNPDVADGSQWINFASNLYG